MEIRDTMLPVLRPLGGEEEVQALREVIESGWWGKGPKVAEFEEKFAKMVGHKYAVAVTSASHGQDLVMKAMGWKGIDVINPAISFIATAMIPLWNNFTTNIVDVKRDTLCIDPQDVEKYKKPNSELLIAVDEAGVLADYKELRKVFGGFILEDCAHSCWTPGAGLGGDCAVWSFQAAKTMPMGDGGMITTDSDEYATRMRLMRLHGIDRDPWNNYSSPKPKWDYDVVAPGFKYNLPDINAAIGVAQLERAEDMRMKRQKCAQLYNEHFSQITSIDIPVLTTPMKHHSWHLYPIIINNTSQISRDDVVKLLFENGISTSVHYKPLYLSLIHI